MRRLAKPVLPNRLQTGLTNSPRSGLRKNLFVSLGRLCIHLKLNTIALAPSALFSLLSRAIQPSLQSQAPKRLHQGRQSNRRRVATQPLPRQIPRNNNPRTSPLLAPANAPEQIALPFDDPLPAPNSAHGAHGDNVRHIRLGQEVLAYHFKRGRRKSIGFMLDGEGLHVTAPRWVTLAEVESALHSKARWILAKRAEWAERQRHSPLPQISWQTGSVLPYMGGQIKLSLGTAMQVWLEQPLQIQDLPTLHLPLTVQASVQQIRDRVHGWLQQQAKHIFAQRLQIYTEKLGGEPIAWTLSSATTQWGSCTADGKIRLNWRLVHFPLSVIDYVIAHELAHLKEMNHGPQFWQTVAQLFPDYLDAKQALKFVQPETLYEA